MRRYKEHISWTIAAILMLLILPVRVYVAVENQWHKPISTPPETLVWVPSGVGLHYLSNHLKTKGLIADTSAFRLGIELHSPSLNIRHGEFDVTGVQTIEALLDALSTRPAYQRQITLVEGESVAEFLMDAKTSPYIDDDLAQQPKEGSLMPETYNFTRGEKLSSLITRMQAPMTAYLNQLWNNRGDDFYLKSKSEALIMASIIEKESGVKAERPIIASVFKNRLKRNMRLQSDPTVIYGITFGKPLERSITRADLEEETAFNTYKITGLPPTPITNPGKAALDAVFDPAYTQFLYFVADGSGGHNFARNLKEHNKNVRNWRENKR